MENVSKYDCYMFLALEKTKKDILTVFCKILRESNNVAREKEETRQIVMLELQKNINDKSYDLKYIGVVHYEDIDQELKDHEDEIFEKYNDVWLLKSNLVQH